LVVSDDMASLVTDTFRDASLGLSLYPILLEYPGGSRVVTISACVITSTNPLDKAMLVQPGDIAVSVASTIDGRAVSLIRENTAESDEDKQRSLEESFEAHVSTISALKPPRRLVVYRLQRPVLLDTVARVLHRTSSTAAATATAATALTETEATVLVDAHYEPDAASGAGADAAVPLPAGWRSAVDAASGRTYYYNEVSRESQFAHPGRNSQLIVAISSPTAPAAADTATAVGAPSSSSSSSSSSSKISPGRRGRATVPGSVDSPPDQVRPSSPVCACSARLVYSHYPFCDVADP